MPSLTEQSTVLARMTGRIQWGDPVYRLLTEAGDRIGTVAAVGADPATGDWVLEVRDGEDQVLAVVRRPTSGQSTDPAWRLLDPDGAELARLRKRSRVIGRPRMQTSFTCGLAELARSSADRPLDPWPIADDAGRELVILTALPGARPPGADRRIALSAAGAADPRRTLALALAQLLCVYAIPPKDAGRQGRDSGWLAAIGDVLDIFN